MVTATEITAQPENAEYIMDIFATCNSIRMLVDQTFAAANIMANKGTLGTDNYTKFHKAVDLLTEINNELLGRL